jgi:hypothetical protein
MSRTIVPSEGARPRPLARKRAPLSGRSDARAIGSLSFPVGVVNQGGGFAYVYGTPAGVGVANHGGPIIVSAPLKVIFWGGGWRNAGTSPSLGEVEAAVRAIVASPYLDELRQYGFSQIDSCDFYQVLADPPGPTFSDSDVESMVWGAIDGGAFPEPDEPGGRNIYMVFPHPGTSYANKDLDAAGAHSDPSDYDFPADIDYAWVGWVNYGTLDEITAVFTHELVEMITDPEPDSPGWITNQPSPLDEIADICVLQNGPVAGYAAAAYYSARLRSCVVASHRLQRRIQLNDREKEIGPRRILIGETTADGRDICLRGTYGWTLISHAGQVVITADVSTYSHPDLNWTVNGTQIFGNQDLKTDVDNGFDPVSALVDLPSDTTTIAVELPFESRQLTLSCQQGSGAAVLTVSCTAEEAQSGYNGYPTTHTDTIDVLISGRTRFMDDRFAHDRGDCFIKRLGQLYEQFRKFIDKGDPVPPWVGRGLAELEAEMQALDRRAEQLLSALTAPRKL